jgi:arylsulfatase A-like enzyme
MPPRPNLLFLHVDQLNLFALGANGCADVATPNLDRLWARGVSFRHSSVANPICSPSRTCWYTGLMSEEHGQLTNDRRYAIDPATADIGPLFRRGGYDAVYMGKWHIAKPAERSFDVQFNGHVHGELGDAYTARAAEAFLANRQGGRPFFLNVGLLNPHDSCMWAYNFTPCSPAKFGQGARLEGQLPALPPNHRLPAYPSIAAAPVDPTGGVWSDRDWRYYLYSYYRQVEMVDAEVGRILDALEHSRFADNTVLVFASDHGDGLAQHFHYGNDCLFDHSVMAPLVVVPPGATAGRRDETHMISSIDVTATLCDYAGLDPLPGRRGLSLRPLVENRPAAWRPYAAASAAECRLRMIRTPAHKLIHDRVTNDYALYDLANDPWEMSNVARDAAQAAALAQLKLQLSANEATYHYAPQAARMVHRWAQIAG